VSRPDNREVAPVESRNFGDIQSLCERDDGSIGSSKRQVTVLEDKLSHPAEIFLGEVDEAEVAVRNRAEEDRFRASTSPLD